MPDTGFSEVCTDGPELLTPTRHRLPDDTGRVRPAVPGIGRRVIRAEPTWGDEHFPASGQPHPASGALSGGRGRASGSGHSDGNPFRQARGRGDLERPCFDIAVQEDGYAWWYVDGLSDDGSRAISIIGFIGSVFSPWYRWSGRRKPHNHCCINVATYGPGARWTMTDRGQQALRLSEDSFQVGPSSFNWDGDRLVIDLNEISTPHGQRIAGTVTIHPEHVSSIEVPLKEDGSHIWRPFAPSSRIEVDIARPGWKWSGHGYFDANFGTAALEADFSYWTWARLPHRGGTTSFYDATRRDGSDLEVALHFGADGSVSEIEAPPKTRLARSLWAVRRETRADAGYAPRQVKHMLDAPFYSRSAIRTKLHGEEVVGVHEALDLNRFRSPLLMPMLAVRVPRRAGWNFADS